MQDISPTTTQWVFSIVHTSTEIQTNGDYNLPIPITLSSKIETSIMVTEKNQIIGSYASTKKCIADNISNVIYLKANIIKYHLHLYIMEEAIFIFHEVDDS